MTEKEISELVKKYGFDVKEEKITINQSGLDFLVVLAEDQQGEKWVLRIPRREDVQEHIRKEQQILEVVEPNLAVQAPKWEIISNELIAYKALTGVPAGTINQEEQRYDWVIDPENLSDSFIHTLAKGMVSLHQIPLEKIEQGGLAVQTIEDVRTSMKSRMDLIKKEFGVNEQRWKRWQHWLTEDSYWPKHTGFIHGDLHAGHILVDEKERVTGFIDWTEAKVADVSTDFVGHLRTYGEDELKRLLVAYEEAGGTVWPRMEAHIIELAATYPVDIAEFALKSGIEEYAEMARSTLME